MTQQGVYPIDHNLGDCVIFNIATFRNNEQTPRVGTNKDKEIIEDTFSNFGYIVHSVQDPTEADINQRLDKICEKNQADSSSFICFILSHGTSGNKIITHDNKEMALKDIIQKTDIPDLVGKPKIFVIQACRGLTMDRGVEPHTPIDKKEIDTKFDEIIPVECKPDFLLIFATPPGYVSYRGSQGSAFIQMLCYVLEKHRNQATVGVLLQRLILTVSSIPFQVINKTGWFLQVPYFTSTLQKSLKLHHSASEDLITTPDINTIVNCKAEIWRRKIFHLLQEVGGVDENNVPLHTYDDSLYHNFLLEETSGCYNLSDYKERHCIIINTATTNKKAMKDCEMIEKTMSLLKFRMCIPKENEKWKIKFDKGIDREHVGCFFCFILIEENNYKSETQMLTETFSDVINERGLLHKPKIYVIQRYMSDTMNNIDGKNHATSSSERQVRYSRELDVLIVQVLPVGNGQLSFIELFCEEYPQHAQTVAMLDFLERVLPEKFQNEWISLQPTVCSTMRKHFVIKDAFLQAEYKSENLRVEKNLCCKLEIIYNRLLETSQRKVEKESGSSLKPAQVSIEISSSFSDEDGKTGLQHSSVKHRARRLPNEDTMTGLQHVPLEQIARRVSDEDIKTDLPPLSLIQRARSNISRLMNRCCSIL